MSFAAITLLQVAPVILVFIALYFAFIRPQKRRLNQHRMIISNLGIGDSIVTQGGIYGTIVSIPSDNDLIIRISPAVEIKIRRIAVSELLHAEYHIQNSIEADLGQESAV